jgi:hypothetical protein
MFECLEFDSLFFLWLSPSHIGIVENDQATLCIEKSGSEVFHTTF